MKEYFVYIIECWDGSYYTGFTIDIEERMKKHKSGKGSKYVKAKGFRQLIYSEKYLDQSKARKRENEIKSLTKKEKIDLIFPETI